MERHNRNWQSFPQEEVTIGGSLSKKHPAVNDCISQFADYKVEKKADGDDCNSKQKNRAADALWEDEITRSSIKRVTVGALIVDSVIKLLDVPTYHGQIVTNQSCGRHLWNHK